MSKTGELIQAGSAHSSTARLWQNADRLLAQIETTHDALDLVDLAEAARVWAIEAKLGIETVNHATLVKVLAERRLAEIIDELQSRGYYRQQGTSLKGPDSGLLKDLGVTSQRLAEARKLGALQELEIRDEVERLNTANRYASRAQLVKQGAARLTTEKRREASRNADPLPDGMTLVEGDAREILDDPASDRYVESDSVALVLTDPPYGDEAEPLYEWLGRFAERTLVPGGSLICYTGQSRLNRDIAIFDNYLRYWWLLAMMHDRSQRLPGKFVVAEFKPVLWYVKGNRRGRSLVTDVLSSERDKSIHPWAQGTGGAGVLIEQLTEPGETVVDPFAGTATWGKLATRMGRYWIGTDIHVTDESGSTEIVA